MLSSTSDCSAKATACSKSRSLRIAASIRNGRWRFGAEFLVRSQELAPTFCPTGAVWWARCADLLAQNTFYGSPHHLAEIDANRGVDIDDEEDLRLAELLVLGLTARDGRSPLEPMKESYFHRGRACATK